MKRLGVIGRADLGGIASQSFAVAQHMKPAAALVLDMEGRGRGPFDPGAWLDVLGREKVRVATFPFSDDDLDWFLDRSDVIFTVEGPPPGRDDFPDMASRRGLPLFIHTNPELWKEAYRGGTTRLALPTTWHAERFPGALQLPMPVDRARFPYRHRGEAATFLHVAAPAFHDRNGTELLRAALPLVRAQVRFYVHGVTEGRETGRVGNVELIFPPPCPDNRAIFPDDADVLVLPRRYGGQCLTLNEAASLGMPAVMLDLPPQNERSGVCFVDPHPEAPHQHMIGGQELVHDASPSALAATIDMLAGSPPTVGDLSRGADKWASAHDWTVLKPLWVETLGL